MCAFEVLMSRKLAGLFAPYSTRRGSVRRRKQVTAAKLQTRARPSSMSIYKQDSAPANLWPHPSLTYMDLMTDGDALASEDEEARHSQALSNWKAC